MEILFFSPFVSHPVASGVQKRIVALADALKKEGHHLHLLALPLYNPEVCDLAAVRSYWSSVEFIQPEELLQRPRHEHYLIDDWCSEELARRAASRCTDLHIDTIIVNYVFFSRILDYVPAGVHKVIDTHDRYAGRREMFPDTTHNIWYHTTEAEEAAGLIRADTVLAIRADERDYFEKISGRPVLLARHPEEEHFTGRTFDRLTRVGLVGSANQINIDSFNLLWEPFRQWSHSHNCTVKLCVAGLLCDVIGDDPALVKYGRPGSLDDFYNEMDVVINPSAYGTGLKIKTVEALSRGLPLLSTVSGSDGIEVSSPWHRCKDSSELLGYLEQLRTGSLSLQTIAEESRQIFNGYHQSVRAELATALEALSQHSTVKYDTGHDYYYKRLLEDRSERTAEVMQQRQDWHDLLMARVNNRELESRLNRQTEQLNRASDRLNALAGPFHELLTTSLARSPLRKVKHYKKLVHVYTSMLPAGNEPATAPAADPSGTAGRQQIKAGRAAVLRDDPVFILGYPRSGTTFLQALLCTQPNMASLPETHFFTQVQPALQVEDGLVKNTAREMVEAAAGFFTAIKDTDRAAAVLQAIEQPTLKAVFEQLVALSLETLYEASPAELTWIEKTPGHSMFVNQLARLYPKARFIHITRNPLQTLPAAEKMFRTWHKDSYDMPPYDLLAARWNRFIEHSEEFKQQGGRLEFVRFEDLEANRDETLSALCAACDLTFDPALLENYSRQVDMITAPGEDWKAGLKKDSEEAVNRYELSPFTARRTIDICGQVMSRHGYTTAQSNSPSADQPAYEYTDHEKQLISQTEYFIRKNPALYMPVER